MKIYGLLTSRNALASMRAFIVTSKSIGTEKEEISIYSQLIAELKSGTIF